MSEALPGIEDLTKLKLSDLKKICKENKLPSTGTKTELISRISEVQGNKFVILQPGDEAELLGDSNDGDSTDVSSITQTTTADLTSSKSPTDDLDFAMTSPPSSTTTTTATKISSKKRRASDDLNPEDILSVEKKIAIEPVSSATTATVASIGVDHPTAECKDTTTAGLSDAERLALRAKRFGGSTSNGTSILSDSKLIERAKRFGLPINSSSIGGDSLEVDELGKLKQRAERFGQTTSKTLEKTVCSTLSMKNKIRIFNSNVKSLLLYGWIRDLVARCGTKGTSNKLQTFINTPVFAQYYYSRSDG
ncbi:unnamed protein product [Trichobilharzia szidati]|nr:unnamed protein product [Trichobilharzia szidati]